MMTQQPGVSPCRTGTTLTSCRSMRHGIERPLPGHAYIGNRFLKVFAFDAENSTPEANQ